MSNLSQFAAGGDPQYWVSGTTYALGKTVRSPADHQRYVRVVGGAGTTDPANDATNWRPDGGRTIKSIQRGVITIVGGSLSATATVASVNTAKSELSYLGGSSLYSHSGSLFATVPHIVLTNPTTVTATLRFASDGDCLLSWQLTEHR